jgi:hypothetical protein
MTLDQLFNHLGRLTMDREVAARNLPSLDEAIAKIKDEILAEAKKEMEKAQKEGELEKEIEKEIEAENPATGSFAAKK